MGPQLLDIQPCELRFLLEVKKQSSCSILLVNKSHNHVAFKIKTTSPKKYCVRPNVGIIMPKSSYEFTVTMQAQRSVPPDMSCKDKFLVQSTSVAAGTTDEDITSSMFSKEEGKYVEENKLKVSLISPLGLPVLSPANGKVEYGNKDVPFLKDGSSGDDFLLQEPMVSSGKSVNSIKVVKGEERQQQLHAINVAKCDRSPERLHEIEVVKIVESPVNDAISLEKDDVITSPKDARIKLKNNLLKVKEEVRLKTYTKDVRKADDVEGAKLIEVVQRMKLKLDELEFKLSQTEFTISKLTAARQRERQQILKQEPELSMSFRTDTRASQIDGFPLLFVVMVALLSLMFGYLIR